MTRRVALASVAASLLAATTASGAPGPPKVAARPGLPEIVSVTAWPASRPGGPGQVLRSGRLNTVVAKRGLFFRVTLHNVSSAAHNVTVRLILGRTPLSLGPVVKVRTLHLAPNQWRPATFGNLGPISFAVKTTLQVNTQVMLGKVRQIGWTRYPVIFALG